MASILYILAGLAGVSALIDAEAWIHGFADVFGATTPVTLLVISTWLLGAAIGAYLGGIWADHRRDTGSREALRGFGRVAMVFAGLSLVVSLLLPYLGFLSGLV